MISAITASLFPMMNAFVILALDHLYLREYIMQLACYTKGKF